jgi:hypothetical protein
VFRHVPSQRVDSLGIGTPKPPQGYPKATSKPAVRNY